MLVCWLLRLSTYQSDDEKKVPRLGTHFPETEACTRAHSSETIFLCFKF
jgi:hypothetical protein